MENSWLRKMPAFAELSDSQIRRIAAVAISKTYAADEPIFFEDEPGEGIHFVESGQVKIFKSSEDGREHILAVLGTGEIFAEVLLFQNRPYPASVTALQSSRIGMIPNRALEKLVLEEPELALALIRVLSRRLVYVQSKVKGLALHNVLARTAQALLSLKGRNLPSRQDLAGLVGTTRESVTRALSLLKQKEVICEEHKKLLILNEQALRYLAETGRFVDEA